MFLATTIKTHKENQGLGLWEPHGGPKGVRAGPGTPILGPKHQKLSETNRRASVWYDIRTILILPGLGSLWDAFRASKRPKMGHFWPFRGPGVAPKAPQTR